MSCSPYALLVPFRCGHRIPQRGRWLLWMQASSVKEWVELRFVEVCGYSSGRSRGGGVGARWKHTGPGMPLSPIHAAKLSTKLVSFTGADQYLWLCPWVRQKSLEPEMKRYSYWLGSVAWLQLHLDLIWAGNCRSPPVLPHCNSALLHAFVLVVWYIPLIRRRNQPL